MNNNLYFESSNATVISFPAFGAGKFLTNCLSLSRHACPQHSEIAEYLLRYPSDYDYRLTKILKTIPDKSQMKQWRSFEFGESKLFGDVVVHWKDGNNQHLPNKITQELCESGLKFFMVDHSMVPSKLLTVWPNATVIKITNTEKFQTIAAALKDKELRDLTELNGNYCKQKYNLLRGGGWPDWQEFERVGYDISKCSNVETEIWQEIEQFYPLLNAKNQVLFNLDDCVFDTDKFLNSMEQLYVQLGFDDFQPAMVKQFYTAYISLHI